VFRGEDSVELDVAGKSLTLAGQARRSCAAPSAAARDSALQWAATAFTALGQEPGWRADLPGQHEQRPFEVTATLTAADARDDGCGRFGCK
jgi:hypothetical protein